MSELGLLTYQEAAEALGFKRMGYKAPAEAVRLLCRQRKLRHAKIGKRVMIRRKWLEEYVEREAVETL